MYLRRGKPYKSLVFVGCVEKLSLGGASDMELGAAETHCSSHCFSGFGFYA